jgi:hypothetical protein
METLASSEIFLFEDFRLDRRGGGLFRSDRDGAFTAVAIGSRGLDSRRIDRKGGRAADRVNSTAVAARL